MTWPAPTVAEFKARFPTFADVPNAVVQTALDEGALKADSSWASEADYRMGHMLYAAHVLTLDGYGTGMEAQQAQSGTFGVRSFRSGPFSVDYGSGAGVGGGGESSVSTTAMTSYGRRYLDLLKANKPAILVV